MQCENDDDQTLLGADHPGGVHRLRTRSGDPAAEGPLGLVGRCAEADVAQQIFGTLSSPSSSSWRPSSRPGVRPRGRRKVFVLVASLVYGYALFVLAAATGINGFLVGMAVSGLGFGVYVAVDLALVTQVLPDEDTVAKDLGVLNIAGALPFTIAPASLQRFWPSAAAATASCTPSPGSAQFSGHSPSCP